MEKGLNPLHYNVPFLEDYIQEVFLALFNKGQEFILDLKDKDKRHIGVIAQELERVYTELVFEHENTNIKSVNYNGLSAILIECVKELKTENNLLKQRLTVLENSIEKDKLNK